MTELLTNIFGSLLCGALAFLVFCNGISTGVIAVLSIINIIKRREIIINIFCTSYFVIVMYISYIIVDIRKFIFTDIASPLLLSISIVSILLYKPIARVVLRAFPY